MRLSDEIRLLKSEIQLLDQPVSPVKKQAPENTIKPSIKPETQKISPELSQEMYNTLKFFSSAKGPNFSHLLNVPKYIELPGGAKISQ